MHWRQQRHFKKPFLFIFSMKVRQVIYTLSTLLMVGMWSASPIVQADIFSWTDENGVRHFSDSPPGNLNEVDVTPEIPHDPIADQKTKAAHQELVRQAEEDLQASEKRELEERLKRTEKKLQAAHRKAEEALDAAQEAREIAEEKQRYREIYVVPGIGPDGNRPPRPVPYDPYKQRTLPRQ
jgi:hypothetical protein